MTTIVGSRRDGDGNSAAFYDSNTQETLVRLSPIRLDEDFLGPGVLIPAAGAPAVGYPWVSRLVRTAGTPTVGVLPNALGGIVGLALDATGEKQEASLYANDVLNWGGTLGLFYEARAALSVVPTALVEAVWGMQSAWIDGPDNAAYYARFQVLASGAVNMQTKDGVTTKSFPTSVVLAPGAFHIFKIDSSDGTNVNFSIDGTLLNTSGQLTFATPGSLLQPYASVYKVSGTGVGALELDMIQVASNRV